MEDNIVMRPAGLCQSGTTVKWAYQKSPGLAETFLAECQMTMVLYQAAEASQTQTKLAHDDIVIDEALSSGQCVLCWDRCASFRNFHQSLNCAHHMY